MSDLKVTTDFSDITSRAGVSTLFFDMGATIQKASVIYLQYMYCTVHVNVKYTVYTLI